MPTRWPAQGHQRRRREAMPACSKPPAATSDCSNGRNIPADWDPTTDARLPVWEALHQLIRVFKTEGESGAGERARCRAVAKPKQPGSWPTGSTRSANAQAGPRMPAPTTN